MTKVHAFLLAIVTLIVGYVDILMLSYFFIILFPAYVPLMIIGIFPVLSVWVFYLNRVYLRCSDKTLPKD